MKNLHCFTSMAYPLSRCFVYAYEKETTAVTETFKPKEDDEKLPEYKDIEAAANSRMAAVKKQQMEALKSGQGAARDSEKRELTAFDQKIPAEKRKHDKLKIQVANNEAIRAQDLVDAATAFDVASAAALGELKAAIDAAHKKRTEAAESFATSMMKDLMAAETEGRKAGADKGADALLGGVSLYQDKVTMPNFMRDGKGNLGQKEGGGPSWDRDQVRHATKEMLKAIYIEQGAEEAKKKSKELYSAIYIVKEASGKVNYFSWHKAFGGHERGGFAYVLDTMCFDTNKGPAAFGKVVGYMNSADKIFKGADKKFAQYEAALQKAIQEGQDYPSPSEWARQNAPEIFSQPKDAAQFIDKVLESYKLPKSPTFYESYKKGVSNLLPSVIKECKAYDENIARKGKVRALLLGVLAAEPDSSKWDALAKRTMT
ncbi:hypothetical protein KKH03_00345, partial [Patescibacteria group bacterium]|nr:hypothetical protein [Patescibacteria group bacterium]